ncbi:Hypothetical predicted protein [Cloeon dipterum]|nr:Hypothetical predicted protein [Cloeon dipterum]
MAVFTQTLWSMQQQSIYQQESLYLSQMGAADNHLVQQANATALVSVEFEVFGQVQGVYFTKYCRDMCTQLGIGGWVKNSKKGTIVGKMQGEKIRVDQM